MRRLVSTLPAETEIYPSVSRAGLPPPPTKRMGYIRGWATAGILGAAGLIGVGAVESERSENAATVEQLEAKIAELQEKFHALQDRVTHLDEQVSVDELPDNIQSALKASVTIRATHWGRGPSGRQERSETKGTGVIIEDTAGKYYIITNEHVINISGEDPTYTVETFTGSDYKTKNSFTAHHHKVNGSKSVDKETDLGLLTVPEDVVQKMKSGELDAKPIRIRDFQKRPLREGEKVYIVGNPLEYTDCVADGCITKLGAGGHGGIHMIVSAAINPGNSGGPIVDAYGEYIGTIGWKSAVEGAEGIGGGVRGDTSVILLEKWNVDVVSDEMLAYLKKIQKDATGKDL